MAFHSSMSSPIGRTHDHPCQWTHLCTNHILLAISTTSEGPHIVMPEASQKLHLSGNMNPMMPNAPSPPSPPPLHPVFTSLKIRLPSTRSWKASVIFFTSFFCQTKKKDTSQNLNWSGYLLPWKMDKKMSKNLLSHEVWTKSETSWQRIVHTNGHLDTWTHDEVLLAKILLTSSRSLGLETKPQCHMLQSPPDGQDWWSSGHKQWKKGQLFGLLVFQFSLAFGKLVAILVYSMTAIFHSSGTFLMSSRWAGTLNFTSLLELKTTQIWIFVSSVFILWWLWLILTWSAQVMSLLQNGHTNTLYEFEANQTLPPSQSTSQLKACQTQLWNKFPSIWF